jgi:hypothetical protein
MFRVDVGGFTAKVEKDIEPVGPIGQNEEGASNAIWSRKPAAI